MGIWDVMYTISDGVKGYTPDLSRSTVSRAGVAAYSCTSAAVTKIDQVVRVDGIQKLPEYWPQITLFTTTLAKNSAKYALYEGFKHIPGATVATKLVSDTMREVKQQSKNDGMKAKVDKLEKDVRSLNGKLRSGYTGEGGPENVKDVINGFMTTEFVRNQMFRHVMVPKVVHLEKKNEVGVDV